MRITVRVTPRASRDVIAGTDAEGRLLVRVTAAPTDGQANAAATRLLAAALDIPQRDVTLISGATSRVKAFEIPLEPAEVAVRLGLPARPNAAG